MNQKMLWLRNAINSMNLQGMIVSNPVNIYYLTNIKAEGTLLLTRKEIIYLTDGRYIEDVQNTITLFDEIMVYNIKDLDKDDLENLFMYCENVGFEENYVTYAEYKELIRKYKINNLVETENIIEKQRMIKDEVEIESIKAACDITNRCFELIEPKLVPGVSEKEIAMQIDEYFYRNSEGPAFETIVASGENSSKPHAVPGNRKFEEQDIITIDIGCKINGYCSDMTRTFFIGEPTEEQKKVYDLVKANHDRAIDEIREGANVKILSKSVENDFNLYGFSLIHSLGHGVGLDIHEKPFVNSKNDFQLRENMVVTVEPGIYIPGKFGVRIEDTILVEKYSARKLS